MKSAKIPAVIPPAYTPQLPTSNRTPTASTQTPTGFTTSGASSLVGSAPTRKRSLIGGAS